MADYTNAVELMSGNPSFEPQQKQNFKVVIDGWQELVCLSCENFPLPKMTVEEQEVMFGNQSIYFAGKATIEGGDVTFVDYVPLDIAILLQTWANSVYNPRTGVRGKAKDYKRTAQVLCFEGDMKTPTHVYQIKGIWPTAHTPDDMSYTEPGLRKITMTLKFDNGYLVV